jgi:hypothetical protein
MKRDLYTFLFIIFSLLVPDGEMAAQDPGKTNTVDGIVDSLSLHGLITRSRRNQKEIELPREEAIKYLEAKYISGDWTNPSDPLRTAIGRLIFFASVPPYDSIKKYLSDYKFDTLNIPWENFYKWDTLKVKIPVILHPEFVNPSDSLQRADTIGLAGRNDSLMVKQEVPGNDSTGFYKPVLREQSVVLKDTIILVARDSIINVLPYQKENPFWIYRYPQQGDSLAMAVKSLTDYLTGRDSTVINFRGIGDAVIPVWVNSKSHRFSRYWLKNDVLDSVTIWIGSLERNTIDLFLEEGIMFRRPSKQTTISDAQLNLKNINTEGLQEVNKIYVKPRYWKVRAEANFVLNQALLSNWVKGGESSVSTTMDITGYANYSNKSLLLSSNNFARIKYGLVATSGEGVRKNLDLIETNSKLNHKAFGKVDFSATMLFKTQLSVGRSYFKVGDKDTSIIASKFMNPATLTIGLGLDYKPSKNTSINFAPFSYKGTYVTDPASIDETKYGVPAGKKALNEPGASLQVTNEFRPVKTVVITNRVQLFTNYIHNPQNIDIDWEMIAAISLNWFTDVRLNTHLIYDDDTKTAKLDENDNPILGDDGKPKKSARPQFKELLGVSFVFRF